jgi:hypothetical protein
MVTGEMRREREAGKALLRHGNEIFDTATEEAEAEHCVGVETGPEQFKVSAVCCPAVAHLDILNCGFG